MFHYFFQQSSRLAATTRDLTGRVWALDRNFKLFLLANVFVGFGMCVDASVFNNYLRDVYHLGVSSRTILEFPRELPGFLSAFFVGILFALGDIRMAALANLLVGAGMFLFGIIPPMFGLMLSVVFVYSAGQHLFMPLANTIGMGFAQDGKYGKVLGRISAANTAALVSGSLILMALFHFLNLSYFGAFTIGAIAYCAASVCIFMMGRLHTPPITKRWVFRKEYRLFYWLSVLWGARKQLFLTFGPWVIVDIFRQPVTTMTALFLTISVLGIFIKPWIGSMIDRIGERPILAAEAVIIAVVCLVYAFAADVLPSSIALMVICGCYVLDQSSSSVSMARATYLRKIAIKPEDISPTLSLGISIDHIASMFLPMLGGIVWNAGGPYGYKYVFMGGALIAVANWISVRYITTPATTTQAA